MAEETATTDAGDAGTPTPEEGATILNSGSPDPDTSTDTGTGEEGSTDTGAAEEAGEQDQTGHGSYADFTVPEGMELNSALLEQAVPVFQELGLTQEQAQKLIDIQAAEVQAAGERQVDTFNQLLQDWLAESKADKEIGGDKFEQTVKVAQNAISKFGTPELKQLLDQHGVGNHPEMIRFMARVGATLKEDNPGGEGNNSQPPQDRVSILYPKTANQ